MNPLLPATTWDNPKRSLPMEHEEENNLNDAKSNKKSMFFDQHLTILTFDDILATL
jgi:hypothetical protein